MKNILKQNLLDLLYSLAGALVIGLAVAVFSPGSFLTGWLGAGVISLIVLFALLKIWRGLGAGRAIGIIMLVTLVIRIAFGIFSYAALPIWGYDTPTQNAGFLYSDAQGRDFDAFDIAQRKSPLYTVFTNLEVTDQYGGMIFLSALVYRTLSPDVSRPLLISLLAAFAMAAGVAFLFVAIRSRWSKKIAVWAGWIFALYPDGILVGSSQMREPFLIGLACVAFWAILQWREKPLRAAIVFALAMAVTCPFSIPSGLVISAILATIFLLDWTLQQQHTKKRIAGFSVLALVAFGSLVGGWMWLRETLYFDTFTTISSSGWITSLIEQFGEQWKIPFVTIYGLTQPLLPAAIFEPSIPFWVTIAIIRGLAWYAALPPLLYGFFAMWKKKEENNWLIRLLYTIFFLWVIVSSARAGGDLWDNPRYRFILLPFMALIIAWAVEHFRKTRSSWLWRWAAVIGVFLLFFTNFYANRYTESLGVYIPFVQFAALIVVFSVLIVGAGLLFDLAIKKKKSGING